MVIDVFSKYGWAIPLKFKTGVGVKVALQEIFKERVYKSLWVDEGTEFYNKNVITWLKKHDVHINSTNNAKENAVNVGIVLLKDNYGNILPRTTHTSI